MRRTAVAGRWLAALAVVAAGLATGCSVVHPATSTSGMENQIIKGEQVSAETRAQAARQVTGPAAPAAGAAPAAATPAGAAAAAAAAAAAGHAASHARSSPPRRAREKVRGRQVTAIGDSVMAAGAVALPSVLPGIYIDAEPDRQMPAGLAVIRRLAQAGRLRPVVVVGLGTNYLVTTNQLRELLRLLGPHRKLVLINTYVPDQWSKQVNATEAAFAHEHPGVVLADWYDTIKHRLGLLWPDHIHPMISGTKVYANLVYRAVQAAGVPPKA
jgi:hypothetical protein